MSNFNVSEMPGAIEKPWGWTVDLIYEPTLQISLLDIDRAGFCSIHFHEEKQNRFLVRRGALSIFRDVDGVMVERILRAGDSIDIPAEMIHQFVARRNTRVLEIYTPAHRSAMVRRDDIVRLTPVMI